MYSIPTGSALPTYICAGADGNLWFTEDNTNKIGKCTTSGTITEYPLTVSGSSPLDICLGPDNNLWITEQAGGYLIRYAPSSATFQSINNQTLDGVNITTSPYILGNTQVGIVSDGSNWYSL
jgi:streptogramin lyase